MSHKCFISYHSDDKSAVDAFCNTFSGEFIHKGIQEEDDLIKSYDTDYVMERIRKLYLQDSTVTIVLIGRCTWARRFVDWEVKASLRKPSDGSPPNGLVAIQLKAWWETLPNRVLRNVQSGYSKFYKYPSSSTALSNIIDEAFGARFEKNHLIKNPQNRQRDNEPC